LQRPTAGIAHTFYNKYRFEDPGVATTVERDFVGGLVRVQAGFAAQYARVAYYLPTGTEGVTRLQEDCTAARLVGCSGGFHDTVKLGVALDTRDFEPDPNSGVFVDLTGELSSRVIGSAYDYARVTFSPRAFISPAPKFTDLVIAARAVYSVQTNGAPFFYMNTLAFTDTDRQGLGGLRTMRGYKQDRFVGPIAALANIELRWTFLDFDALGQNFGLSVAPFLDMGRVFDRVGDFTFAEWRRGEGAGLRVAWNKATIIVFDYGVSSEDSGLYMDFGHQF
jgi:outer membrane protein assembly factor BamA